jgi:hypothetical protein
MSDNRIMGGRLSAILVIIAMAVYPLSCRALDEQTEFKNIPLRGITSRAPFPEAGANTTRVLDFPRRKRRCTG